VQCPRSVEGSRQQGEIRLGEFLSPPEQAHDDKEISMGKKRTPEFRQRHRIRHGGDKSFGKDADRKIGGPRYLLLFNFVHQQNPSAESVPRYRVLPVPKAAYLRDRECEAIRRYVRSGGCLPPSRLPATMSGVRGARISDSRTFQA
jgi:hypothetical protein